jgi:hypothetical protein
MLSKLHHTPSLPIHTQIHPLSHTAKDDSKKSQILLPAYSKPTQKTKVIDFAEPNQHIDDYPRDQMARQTSLLVNQTPPDVSALYVCIPQPFKRWYYVKKNQCTGI